MADQLPEGTRTHRSEGDQRPPVACAIVTVSDSRTEATDASGARMRELLEGAGHRVVDYALLRNDETRVREHVRTLVARGAIGLVTTHDLALAEIVPSLGALAANVHFEDRIDGGTMTFDYRMKPGVVTHSNAVALMKSVGLEV